MPILNPLEHPVCLSNPLRLAPTGWAEHVPFAMFLVGALRPRVVVELGTQHGVSYCALCQTVAALSLEARCFAVDTWQGDEQSGRYGPEVLGDLRAHHDPLYGSFSQLIQSTFDGALSRFDDASIDLLHIDGFHSYEAARHDFESWLPKVSARGVVLLHDTNVREQGFGVWRLWEEICARLPHFEFAHGNGLGLVAAGGEPPAELGPLFSATEADAVVFREFFRVVGRRLSLRVERELESAERSRESGERDQKLSQLSAQVGELSEATQRLSAELRRSEESAASLIRQQSALTSRLAATEAQLSSVINSRAWRWVTRYGRFKERYLLPVYRRLLPRP